MFPPERFDTSPSLLGGCWECSGFSVNREDDTTLIWGPHLLSQIIAISTMSFMRLLPNLVSGYECGRVFPAGIGPDPPSRDAANWLLSRFGLSVETRRRYGWLRMVFPGGRPFRAPIWCSLGAWRHARGREHCRGEPGSTLSGGYAPYSAKAEGRSIVDEPGKGRIPARESQRRESGGF